MSDFDHIDFDEILNAPTMTASVGDWAEECMKAAILEDREKRDAEIREAIEALTLVDFSGEGFSEEECELICAAHNDAISFAIEAIKGISNKVDE